MLTIAIAEKNNPIVRVKDFFELNLSSVSNCSMLIGFLAAMVAPGPLEYWRFIISVLNQNANKDYPAQCHFATFLTVAFQQLTRDCTNNAKACLLTV